jgi:hypothetical protein
MRTAARCVVVDVDPPFRLAVTVAHVPFIYILFHCARSRDGFCQLDISLLDRALY